MTHNNFLKELRLRKQKINKTGLVSKQFPEVSHMVIKMTYFRKAGIPVIMKRTVNIAPTNHAYFNMECFIKEGYDRGFDLTPVIIQMINSRQTSVTGQMHFNGKNGKSGANLAKITYEIKVLYWNAL